MDLLYTKYTRALISYEGLYRVETSPVPREAMREAVVNAVAHRDYAASAPTQIQVLKDRIEIWNPADLPPEWKATGRDGKPVSQPHNPRVANAFFRAAMIEAWGRGIRRIVRASVAAGNPTPIWMLDEGGAGLSVTFPFSDAYRDADPLGCGERGETTARKSPEVQKTARILAALRRNPSASRRELAETLGITEPVVRYWLDRLREAGKIERVGPDRGGHWRILGEFVAEPTHRLRR